MVGHPVLGDGRWILTSRLVGLDGEGGWARTLGRWYRLGSRITPGELGEVHGYELSPALRLLADAEATLALDAARREVEETLRPLREALRPV